MGRINVGAANVIQVTTSYKSSACVIQLRVTNTCHVKHHVSYPARVYSACIPGQLRPRGGVLHHHLEYYSIPDHIIR